MKKSKFEIKDMLTIGLVFVVTGVAIAYGLQVQGDVSKDVCSENYYENQCLHCPGGTNPTMTLFNVSNGKCYNTTGVHEAARDVHSEAFNGSLDSIIGVAKIPEKMPLIATVVVAAIIIGIILRYLVFK